MSRVRSGYAQAKYECILLTLWAAIVVLPRHMLLSLALLVVLRCVCRKLLLLTPFPAFSPLNYRRPSSRKFLSFLSFKYFSPDRTNNMIFPSSPKPEALHRNKRALAVLLFVVFVALLGSGIVLYGSASTEKAGLAMTVIGILGLAVLGTSWKLMQSGILRGSRDRHQNWYMRDQMVQGGGQERGHHHQQQQIPSQV